MVYAVGTAILYDPVPQVENKEQGGRPCVRNLPHLINLICSEVIAQLSVVFIFDLEYFALLKAYCLEALPYRVELLIDFW